MNLKADAFSPQTDSIISTLCHGCSYSGYNCGILAHVQKGVMTKVEGNPEHPLNKARLCAKGLAASQWVYNPNRVLHPLKRRGPKGTDQFERISWDEAMETLVQKIRETREDYGPEFILASKGQAAGWFSLHHLAILRFLHALGSPNFSPWSPYVCYGPQLFYHKLTVGGPTYARPDYDNADLILEWFTSGGQGGPARGGVETVDTNLRSVSKKILDRLDQGAKLIVINPQLIPLAANARCDRWVPIRPGTDGALVLGMIQYIIERSLYDKDFVSKWCSGFDALAAHVKSCTPHWAAAVTGLEAQEIIRLAETYATTPRAAIRFSEAPQKKDLQCFGTALPTLIAITGHLDRPGCNIWFQPSAQLGFDVLFHRLSKHQKARVLGGDRFYVRRHGRAFAHFPDVIRSLIDGTPYRPRTMLLYGSNPLNTARDPSRIARALKQLDFLVQFDVTLNPTSCFADLVLPAATRYECGDQPCLWGNHLAMSRRVIPPLGECRDELTVTLDLAKRLGLGKDLWEGDRETMVREFLAPSGVSLEDLRNSGPKGIYLQPCSGMKQRERYTRFFSRLPEGRVQLFNRQLVHEGFEAVPTYQGEPEDLSNAPELQKAYPLLFTDEHSDSFSHHSWMRDLPWLRDLRRHPFIKMHPLTAKVYGLAAGDWVEVESPHGRMVVRLALFEGMRQDTVMGQHGWWQGCPQLGLSTQSSFDGGVNPNVLYPWNAKDPITGDISKNTLVRLKKHSSPQSREITEEKG